MDRLSIDFLTGLGMPPVEYVNLAADLGCKHISLGLAPLIPTAHFAPWSLHDDATLRRDVAAALRDRGVSIGVGEGLIVFPGVDLKDRARDFDLLREFGASRVVLCSIDPDRSRTLDQFATATQMAEKVGMGTVIEFGPCFPAVDLAAAQEAIRISGSPNCRLLVDTLHVSRAGLTGKDFAAIDPETIGYIQLCDAPRAFTKESYAQEASFDRKPPGEGELALFELLSSLPRSLPVGLEIPMLTESLGPTGLRGCIARCVTAARSMLARLDS
jgi:sugar phosphate isomerase/epimerase